MSKQLEVLRNQVAEAQESKARAERVLTRLGTDIEVAEMAERSMVLDYIREANPVSLAMLGAAVLAAQEKYGHKINPYPGMDKRFAIAPAMDGTFYLTYEDASVDQVTTGFPSGERAYRWAIGRMKKVLPGNAPNVAGWSKKYWPHSGY